ncbi:hypothetical protein CU102_00410 [Phyllobacterium brassicacearum]|uniref:Uncharacterized protein n=1 Tax=Phyllobacterium brassicacearum TaxID=314235 RepID=A0A2P7BVT1_9HYPH|nr:hypothetical protein [Phyllobacterium brassicacearum]PSH70560.1 hypothetical protein CU102_00410 [Phyllobacterium brassicacearum]TDQ35985.1 hypothetical protein DEV91_101471 [Phyllobacterium brassicacearum]
MATDDAEAQIDDELEIDLAGCAEFVAALQDDHMMWMAYHLLIDLDWIRAGGSVKRHWSSNGHVAGFIADLRGRGKRTWISNVMRTMALLLIKDKCGATQMCSRNGSHSLAGTP